MVALAVITFHELTGENALMLYSTEIFKKMASYKDGDNALSPRTGTILIGVFNLLAHVPAVYLIKRLPRRTLLIVGHLVISTCHLFVALFSAGSNDTGVIVMMIIYIVTYVITNGPLIWLYVSEIVVDAAFGICLFVLWSVILLLSLFTQPLMESFLKPTGVFLVFSFASLWGAHFAWRNVRETYNLSDKEKKKLYIPEAEGDASGNDRSFMKHFNSVTSTVDDDDDTK
jgi:Na+/melibiose symporter-like transporter